MAAKKKTAERAAKTALKKKVQRLPARSDVKTADTWDLASLFPDDDAWTAQFRAWERRAAQYAKYRGRLAESPALLAACLKFDLETSRRGERLGSYAFLRAAEDQANGRYQAMVQRYEHAATQIEDAASFLRPEILKIPPRKMAQMLTANELVPYRLLLERLLRYKPHTLSEAEEALLAKQGEMASAAGRIFRQLLDADLKFGTVTDERGVEVELSHASYAQLLRSPQRSVRREAFHRYYAQFAAHENTLAAALAGSIQKDVYYAKVRGYESARAASLFSDAVPPAVYDNLIAAVRRRLPAVHRYYDVRRRKMRLKEIRHYDTYVPILSQLETRRSWNEAVALVVAALAPLGEEYVSVLEYGLTAGRWCDRYPNRGKQSGAFSAGSYDGAPYILMNYKPEVFDEVFTLAHEAGHSMHSYFSARHQPYQYYDYAIFVAEVASTFNEQLLGEYLLGRAAGDQERAYLVNHAIDEIRGTIIRQTMFAEFEKITHEMAEAGEPLTLDAFRSVYRRLLEDYFGPEFTLDEPLTLECLRIPHFYRAFYVYKYATGLSAAIALSRRVLQGGQAEVERYLGFLRGGCSKYPLDLLRDAGVDMESPEPVDTALAHFDDLVTQLDALL